MELHQENWIKNIGEIHSPVLLNEYVMLSVMLDSIPLNDQDDQIIWGWTSNGHYLVASAYDYQFAGSMTYFPATNIWRVMHNRTLMADNMLKKNWQCRFFAWLVMHNGTLMADNMLKKNWQCDPICPLCFYL
jgi:hypothetical protein